VEKLQRVKSGLKAGNFNMVPYLKHISSLSVFPSQEITLVYSILLARRVSWFLSYYVDGIHFLIRTLMLMKLLMCA
jgi:hypothetical protein